MYEGAYNNYDTLQYTKYMLFRHGYDVHGNGGRFWEEKLGLPSAVFHVSFMWVNRSKSKKNLTLPIWWHTNFPSRFYDAHLNWISRKVEALNRGQMEANIRERLMESDLSDSRNFHRTTKLLALIVSRKLARNMDCLG